MLRLSVRSVAPTAKAPIDLADLLNPLVPLGVLQIQNVIERPVEMIGDIRYLLVQRLRGVARYSPAGSVASPIPSSSTPLIFR